MITLSQNDNGKSIEVNVGETIDVRLDENPSTGYRWESELSSPDILTLTQSDFIPSTSGRVGAAGQRIFTFQSVKSGSVSLDFKNQRAWSGEGSTIARFAAVVKVNG